MTFLNHTTQIKNIVFDLDGTLLNTLDDLANSTNHALRLCGYNTHTTEEVRLMVGNGVANLIKRAMPTNCSEEEFNNCFAAFKQHYAVHCKDLTKPYDGILELLHELKSRGIRMAIVSNKLDSAVKELNQQFFKDYIDVAIGEIADVKRKPAPDMLLKAMEQLGAEKDETIYIGDSDVDIVTAHNTGIPCISVLWGFRDKPFLMQNGATVFSAMPKDILLTIQSLNI